MAMVGHAESAGLSWGLGGCVVPSHVYRSLPVAALAVPRPPWNQGRTERGVSRQHQETPYRGVGLGRALVCNGTRTQRLCRQAWHSWANDELKAIAPLQGDRGHDVGHAKLTLNK